MKYYFNIIGIVILAAVVYGFAVPAAISAKDTAINLGGLALAILAAPTIYIWIKKLISVKNKVVKDEH